MNCEMAFLEIVFAGLGMVWQAKTITRKDISQYLIQVLVKSALVPCVSSETLQGVYQQAGLNGLLLH